MAGDSDTEAPSMLVCACYHGRVELVQTMVSYYTDHRDTPPNSTYKLDVDKPQWIDWTYIKQEKKSALQIVLEEDNVELLMLIHHLSIHKSTLLHQACYFGSSQCLQCLLGQAEYKQYVNCTNHEGDTVLMLASSHGAQFVNILLQCDVYVNSLSSHEKQTIITKLCMKIQQGLPQLLETLLTSGVKVYSSSSSGQSVLASLVSQITWPLAMDDNGNNNFSQLDMSLAEYYDIIQNSLYVLLAGGVAVDPRCTPKTCEKLVNHIQIEVYRVWRVIGREHYYHQGQAVPGYLNQLEVLIQGFTQLLITLEKLVHFGAVINYEHYVSPSIVANLKRTFRANQAYSSLDDIEVHLLYPTMKEFFYMLLLLGQHSVLVERLEVGCGILTRILLAHGISDKEKSNILDLVRLPEVWTAILMSIPNNLYYKHINYALQRIRDRCYFFAYKKREFHQRLRLLARQPRSLMDMCRVSIRNNLGPVITHNTHTLPLPVLLKAYILNFE